jgi:hypothetical protein
MGPTPERIAIRSFKGCAWFVTVVPRWTFDNRPIRRQAKPVFSPAAETSGVLPRGLLGTQVGPDRRPPASARALQHFADNQIGQPETLAIDLRVDPIRLGFVMLRGNRSRQRCRRSPRRLLCQSCHARRVEIAVPGHFASQAADAVLTARPNQQPQSFFHSGALGSLSATAHGLTHQSIVDVNVGSYQRLT